MYYPLSSDYIKYLNDSSFRGLNYDQWKEKKMNEQLERDNKNAYRKKRAY